jgi:uncharacterized membrane protein YphA (DoxX/SURF4 family)
LLLLRVSVGVTALAAGAGVLADHGPPATGAAVISLLAVGVGALLLIGFLTPGAAITVVLGSAGLTLPGCPALSGGLLDAKPTTGFIIVMAIAIVLLGPGAFSLDSYLFGRREIVIPHQ